LDASHSQQNAAESVCTNTTHSKDDFFDFGDISAADVAVNEVDKECANYTVFQEKEATKLWAVTLSNLNRF